MHERICINALVGRLVVDQPDCEAGIPLAYLQGLEECYDAFLHDLETSSIVAPTAASPQSSPSVPSSSSTSPSLSGGPAVLRFDWSGFGDTCAVSAAVRALANRHEHLQRSQQQSQQQQQQQQQLQCSKSEFEAKPSVSLADSES